MKKKNSLSKIKIHFIGIGGIGMSGIAELMNDLGYSIQGSDININSNVKRLQKKGIKFFKGHNKKNIKNVLKEFNASLDNVIDETWFVTDVEDCMNNVGDIFAERPHKHTKV